MILVTGATGLVGTHLLLALSRKGKTVRALRRKSSDMDQVRSVFGWYEDDPDSLLQHIDWIEGDVLDVVSLREAMHQVEVIYHCAGKVSFDSFDRHALLHVNQQGTANVVNTALNLGVKKLCHVSSVSALGKSKQGETIDEQHYWKTSRKNSIYAVSKYAGEREVWRGHEEGLPAVIINPSIIIGPSQWDVGSTRLFSTIYKGVPAYTSGIGGYVDVRDVAEIMIRLMESDISGERFVVSAENCSFEHVITQIARVLNKRPPRLRLYPWMGEAGWVAEHILRIFGRTPTLTKEIARSAFHRFYYDNSKIVQALDYKFIPVDEAIAHTGNIFMKERQKKSGS
jgi:nucleoside-diphosphate-sugar epimerase